MPALGFSKTIIRAESTSVPKARRMPRGMSRRGSTDSSAASGTCSMARNSQTAKGRVARTPLKPKGKSGPLPPGRWPPPAEMSRAKRAKSTRGIALTQKMTSTASESSVTTKRDAEAQRRAEDVEREKDEIDGDP